MRSRDGWQRRNIPALCGKLEHFQEKWNLDFGPKIRQCENAGADAGSGWRETALWGAAYAVNVQRRPGSAPASKLARIAWIYPGSVRGLTVGRKVGAAPADPAG